MEILILIPISLLAMLFWAVIGLGLLRGRVRKLETDLGTLKARLAVLAVEAQNKAQSALAETRASPTSVGELLTQRAEAHPAPPAAPLRGVPPTILPSAPTPAIPVRPAMPRPAPTFTVPPVPVPALATTPAGTPAFAPVAAVSEGKRFGGLNLEQFMGIKLFAWIGGFVAFLGVAFFVKYSFDQGWISPQLRVAAGFLTGLGLLIGGARLKRKAYQVTAHALCGAGVVILYADTFAARAYYDLIGHSTAFALMVLVTVAACLLAIRLPAMVVAVLGLLGGFLTPVLLGSNVDRPLALFGYIAILDLGLVAVALKRRWHFLVAMAAVGTALMQLGWAGKFFAVEKVATALAIFAAFNGLFLGAFVLAQRAKRANNWWAGAAAGLPFVTFAFLLWLLSYPELGARPGMIYSFLLVADLSLLALVLLRPSWNHTHLLAGSATFLLLSIWTCGHLQVALLNWALGGYLGFAVLHSVFPVVLRRTCPEAGRVWYAHLFPPLALVLVLLPLFRELTVPWLVWPVVLLVDALAISLALLTGALLAVLTVLALTVAVTAMCILQVPAEVASLPSLLIVVGGFALFFFIVGLTFADRILARAEATAGGAAGVTPLPDWLNLKGDHTLLRAQIPAFAAILPFLLLIMLVTRLPLVNPTPVFGLALVLLAMLLATARLLRVDLLAPVGLGCVLALECVWHNVRFSLDAAGATLTWNLIFTAVFLAYPFVFRAVFAEWTLPWATAALSGPLHFLLVYRVVKLAWPNEVMGLLPAAFAVPMLATLASVVRGLVGSARNRTSLLAWFGGSALFFITLIFPVQFEKQWITVGWALEGVALLWLFHRVPHPGLRSLGVVLLGVAFVRLALNPAVLAYHPPSGTPILNWFLYSYGIVTASLLAGARLLAPPRNRAFRVNLPPVLYTLGAVLAFLLLNIEIADYFSAGATLTFDFNASLGQDMTYSIAWGLFAFGLLALGFKTVSAGARYGGMGLLVVTLLKLFLHDLWRLGGLYRVGSLIGLAVVLMVVSFIYQRFLAVATAKSETAAATGPGVT